MRGRVISLLSLDRAMVTVGASGAGFLTAALGVQPAQVVYGLICIGGGLFVFLVFKELRAARMQDTFGFSAAHRAEATTAGEAGALPRAPAEHEPART
jgi:hypothetical protein